MSIIICGDLHGDWGSINTLIDKRHPDIIIQVGDFGYFPNFQDSLIEEQTAYGKTIKKKWDNYGIKCKNTKVYWCRGNHDNVDALNENFSKTEISNIYDNVFYCPFGVVLTLPTNEKVLFVGGAKSVDRFTAGRIEGVDWWHQETISYSDMKNLPDQKIDIVVSHTIPKSFLKKVGWERSGDMFNDPSCEALDQIMKIYKPKYLYSGHFHKYLVKYIDCCLWTSLSYPRNGTWWVYHNKV